VIVVIGGLLALLLTMQRTQEEAANLGFGGIGVVGIAVSALLHVWLYVGAWLGWPARWAKWMLAWLVSGDVFAVVYYGLQANGHEGTAIALYGLYFMALLFFVGLWLLRLILTPGLPVVGVARTLLDEAIRMKIPLIFIILLAVLVPILPLLMDPAERLSYQMRSFLTYAMAATSLFLSLMTIFLACATITNEVARKQIFLTMTKPVSRLQYLVGKWLGIVLLNVLLLSVVVSGIYVFARVMEARGVESARRETNNRRQQEILREVGALRSEVLTARRTVQPHPGPDFDEQALFRHRLEELRRESPDLFDTQSQTLDPEQAQQIWNWVRDRWYTVAPANSRVYVFEGLGNAHQYGQTVQLRIRPKLSNRSPDDMAMLSLTINDVPYLVRRDPLLKFAVDAVHPVSIPVSFIDENGRLSLAVHNRNSVGVKLETGETQKVWESSMSFEPGEGMEILYTVGTFEGNLVRAAYVLIVRLSFLAMFALAAGTFTSFPIACMVSLVIYFTAVLSGFIDESLTYFAAMGPRDATGWEKVVGAWGSFITAVTEKGAWETFKVITRVVAELFVGIAPSFSRYNIGPLLADGRVVPNRMLLEATGWIGGLWTGGSLFVAWLIWRKRELAKVTV
jgi:hypothetical protein